MSRASYARIIHPEDTRGVAVLAYTETSFRHDGRKAFRTRNAGATGSELFQSVDTLDPFSMTLNVFRTDPKNPAAHRTKPCKSTWNLAGLNAVWQDLDFYKWAAWRNATPESVVYAVLERCKDLNWPTPSFILASGRGLLLVWLHSRQKPSALPVWRAMQARGAEAFADMNPDRTALACTSAFKLPGVENRKAGTKARILWPATLGLIERYDFAMLRQQMLPYTAEQVAEHRQAQSRERAAKAEKRAARKAAVAAAGGLKLTYETFCRAVHRDVTRLFEHRFQGSPVPMGYRDDWLFALVKAAAWLMPPAELEAEVDRLAPLCGLSQRAARGFAKAAVRRAKRAADGAMDPRPGGKTSDPRYKLNPEHLVAVLGVTLAEMQDPKLDLRVLLSKAVKRRREAQRSQDRREAAGARPRTSAQAARLALGQRVLEKRAAGMTVAAIAADEGVSMTQAEKAQREARQVAAIGQPAVKAEPGRPRKASVRKGFDEATAALTKTATVNPLVSTGYIDAYEGEGTAVEGIVACGAEAYAEPVRSIAPHCDDTDARRAPHGSAGVFVSDDHEDDIPDFLQHLIPGRVA